MSNNYYNRNNSTGLQPAQVEASINDIMIKMTDESFQAKLRQVLPSNVSPKQFTRLAANAIFTHPQKEKFAQCDKQTLFISCQKAASDGINLDGREGVLTAFWNNKKRLFDIAYVPMAQGLVKIARNSGEIAKIDAHVVYHGDNFVYRPGIDNQPLFEPKDWFGDRGQPKGAFATLKLLSGEVQVAIMSMARIMEIAGQGNNAKNYQPTTANYEEWWKKTVIRNVLKYAPKSSELVEKIEKGDNAEFPQYAGGGQQAAAQLTQQSNFLEAPIPDGNSFVDGNEYTQDVPPEDYSQVTWPAFDQQEQCFVDSAGQRFDHQQFAMDRGSLTPLVDGNGQFIPLPQQAAGEKEIWPKQLGSDWVFSDNTLFDPEKHAWSNKNECPSVTKEGLPVAKRGTAAKQKAEEEAIANDPCQGKTRAFEKIYNYIKAAVDEPSFQALDNLKEWSDLDREAGEGLELREIIEDRKFEIFGEGNGK